MSAPTSRIVDLGPEDPLFAPWCEVWAASQRGDRPDDPPRPAQEHVALGRELVAPGGSRTGAHRAAVVDGAVVGALRVLLPLRDNPSVAIFDVAVHPAHRPRGLGSELLAAGRALAADFWRTVLIAEVDEPGPGAPGRAFALAHGWTCDLVETRRDLELPPDEDRLSALEARRPGWAGQGGTLVLREHRGHRLGARLKAAVLRDLAAQLPEVRRISTYNSDGNTPMVAVNEALGFVPAGHLSSWSLRG
ncbi:GNAT family N-acetyltransferase [Blastococcus sp. SYSU DS0539]